MGGCGDFDEPCNTILVTNIFDQELNELLQKIAISIVCGCLIGAQREFGYIFPKYTLCGYREYARRPEHRRAGLRTHMLVCLGACMFTHISQYGFAMGIPAETLGGVGDWDKSRMATAIVSGIGFLGAGTIMKSGRVVSGLNTAASLWVAASIGTAMGCNNVYRKTDNDLWPVPFLVAIITVITLQLLLHLEIAIHKWAKKNVALSLQSAQVTLNVPKMRGPDALRHLLEILNENSEHILKTSIVKSMVSGEGGVTSSLELCVKIDFYRAPKSCGNRLYVLLLNTANVVKLSITGSDWCKICVSGGNCCPESQQLRGSCTGRVRPDSKHAGRRELTVPLLVEEPER